MSSAADPAMNPSAVKHVLVPLDGSAMALRALPTAQALAGRLGATVHTIGVARDEADAMRLREHAAAALEAGADDERVVVSIASDPATEILQRASALPGCVTCLTTHGRGRFGGALVGSVARALLEGSPMPLVALGPEADNPGRTPRPRRWPEPLSTPRIVACVDGTSSSEQVLPIAANWAAALGMSLSALTVAAETPTPLLDHSPRRRFGPEGDAASYMKELTRRWQGPIPGITGEVAEDPVSLESGVRSYLDRRPTGLLALVTHARSGMARARFGAGAARMVRVASVPCLVSRVVDLP